MKERFGRRSVVIEFDGDIGFLASHAAVAHVIHYPRYVEVELLKDASADEVFAALAGRVSVRRFEMVVPSLHKIFVDQLGGSHHEQ